MVIGYRVSVIGYRVSGIGYWVSGIGYRVSGIGYRVLVIGYRLSVIGYWLSGIGYRVLGIGYWVSGIGYRLLGIGYRLLGIGYRVSVIGYRVSVIGYRLSVIGFRMPATTPPSLKTKKPPCSSTKWLFYSLPRQGVDCRGMLSMLSSYPTDSLFPCPSVRSVGSYISLPLSSVLISLRSNDRVAYGEAEELFMLSSKNLHLTRLNAPIQR